MPVLSLAPSLKYVLSLAVMLAGCESAGYAEVCNALLQATSKCAHFSRGVFGMDISRN